MHRLSNRVYRSPAVSGVTLCSIAAPDDRPRVHRMIRYEPNERPPELLAAALAIQYAMLIVTGIVLTVAIVVRAGHGSDGYLAWSGFAVLVVSGISTLLQVCRVRRVGAGYILLMGTSGAFIAVSIAALRAGGPPLLAALVLVSSLFQLVLSQRLSWVRRLFTPTVIGTVVMLIAATIMPIVFGMVEIPAGANPDAVIASSCATLGTFLVIALWVGGVWRLWAPVIGIAAGCSVAAALGHFDLSRVAAAPWFGVPIQNWPGFDLAFGASFWRLLPSFVFVTIIGAVETIGDGIAIQQVSWRKSRAVDFKAVQGAVAADGIGNLLSGLLATVPNTTYSSSVAVVELTGVASRRVGVYIGLVFLVLALFPKFLAVFLSIPDAVAAAYLLVLLSMLFLVGMRMVFQDGVGYRKCLVCGVAFWVGAGLQNDWIFPSLLVDGWRDTLGNGMVSGGLVAILLTLWIEYTNPRPARLETEFGVARLPSIGNFLERFSQTHGLDLSMTIRIRAAAEESLLALADHVDGEASPSRLRLNARTDDAGAELEFLVGKAGVNLEDRLADVNPRATPAEPELSLRLLRHFADSVRHQQFYDVEILIVRVNRPRR